MRIIWFASRVKPTPWDRLSTSSRFCVTMRVEPFDGSSVSVKETQSNGVFCSTVSSDR